MSLSARSQHLIKELSLLKRFIVECNNDAFHLKTNPLGIINLGTASNGITRDILENKVRLKKNLDLKIEQLLNLFSESLCQKTYSRIFKLFLDTVLVFKLISKGDVTTFNYIDNDGYFNYYEDYGIPRLQKAASNFLNEYFKPAKPISSDNIMFATGALSCLNVLCHLIGDPGDLIISPTPLYPITEITFKYQAQLRLWPLPLTSENNFHLSVEKVESVYNEAIQKGNVRGVLLTNPGNPIGDIISLQTLSEIAEFCKRKNIHLILDETYANCVHDENYKFQSVLSCSRAIEMENVHVIYGISKDFGLTSFRVGLVHTTNQKLIKAFKSLSLNQTIPKPIMNTTSKILEDKDFVKHLFQENQKRLSNAFHFCSDRLKEMKVDHLKTPAGVFLWMNLSRFCRPKASPESEMVLFQRIFNEERLYVVPGSQFLGEEPGWFRLTFSKPKEELEIGHVQIFTRSGFQV